MPTEDPPGRTGDTPDGVPAELAVLEASIARTEARWQQLLAGTYQGTDPARLVTAVVDGEGVVVEVRFVRTITRHDPAVVEQAVLAAVSAAQQRLGAALADVTAEVLPPGAEPARGRTGAEPARGRTGADAWRRTGAEPADGPQAGGGVLGGEG
ncbi:YbaB/EbfC family nucleoid-associated protein [Micromonospora sp. WMMD1102]|uniref:YbaB/EbfC family nucleoid-associated protein n=1 Tax=Micromonospora sp. WMMD1102 TaxID=3016105 RepID=UPI0024155367|nr:YbaB/EbfC family nucleoid-associated protein [Micromonospora sp. WMMD1102]MDG4786551.1 YbaB/EbfC family nucleoid-associated protein [Micromonospora sp. WMMD1102]